MVGPLYLWWADEEWRLLCEPWALRPMHCLADRIGRAHLPVAFLEGMTCIRLTEDDAARARRQGAKVISSRGAYAQLQDRWEAGRGTVARAA